MKSFLFNANATYFNIGLLILRVGIGASFIYHHGYGKISDPSRWHAIGENMSAIGVDFAPAFWGFMAAFAEFFGGVFFVLGLFTRPVTLLLAFTMFIAFINGYIQGEPDAYPLEMMIVFIAVLFTGPGKYSIDAKISGFRK